MHRGGFRGNFVRACLAAASLAAAAMAGALLLGGPAHAADPQDGYRLAKQWCTSCHIIGPDGPGSDAARPFVSIAKDSDFTADGIRAWLADPHPPMPNMNLSRLEVEQVVAYLLSLRGQ